MYYGEYVCCKDNPIMHDALTFNGDIVGRAQPCLSLQRQVLVQNTGYRGTIKSGSLQP